MVMSLPFAGPASFCGWHTSPTIVNSQVLKHCGAASGLLFTLQRAWNLPACPTTQAGLGGGTATWHLPSLKPSLIAHLPCWRRNRSIQRPGVHRGSSRHGWNRPEPGAPGRLRET